MFSNYIKTALRNVLRQRLSSIVNVTGLALGLAVCMGIMLFVQSELGYDTHHAHAQRIYRVASGHTIVPAPIGPSLQAGVPGVEISARLFPTFWHRMAVTRERQTLYEDGFFYVEPSLLEVFSIPFLRGDAKTALQRPYSLVITESAAQRHFGSQDPVGQSVSLDIGDHRDYVITGVVEDPPRKTHFAFDMLASFSTLEHEHRRLGITDRDSWSNSLYLTYVRLAESTSPGDVEDGLEQLLSTRPEALQKRYNLQPVPDIHLYSQLAYEIQPTGSINYVYIACSLALSVLLVACVNYVNLATARFTRREAEIGLRKAVGARRGQITVQFLAESLVLTSGATILALIGIRMSLPALEWVTGTRMEAVLQPALIVGIVSLAVLTSLLAGGYPALRIAAMTPVQALKGGPNLSVGLFRSRRVLIGFQFATSMALLICSGVMYRQLEFLHQTDLGFDSDRVVSMQIYRDTVEAYDDLKAVALAVPGVLDASVSNRIPGRPIGHVPYDPETQPISGLGEGAVDARFIPTFGLRLVAGENFRGAIGSQPDACILNETAVHMLGWDSPESALGRQLPFDLYGTRTVIGVVEDFHAQSMHHKIMPVVLHSTISLNYLTVRTDPEHRAATTEALRLALSDHLSDAPVELIFLDYLFAQMYQSEQRTHRTVLAFSLFTVLVACIGLYGLASYMAQARTREVGIRRAVGADRRDIVRLFCTDVLGLLVVSFVVACGFAYYASSRWLEAFLYREELTPWVFLVAGVLAAAVTLPTVGFQALRAAHTRPSEALS